MLDRNKSYHFAYTVAGPGLHHSMIVVGQSVSNEAEFSAWCAENTFAFQDIVAHGISCDQAERMMTPHN
jgi:hypothetical protein